MNLPRLRHSLALVVGCVIGAADARAHAFSDPESFGHKALAAGGEGRYFTGSPSDGYTCKVCHEGGEATKLRVLGLPLPSYRPGASYEVTLDWPDSVSRIAAVLEFTDMQGRPAGSVRLPPQAELQPSELCEPVADGIAAATLSETESGRQIVQLPDCGAKQLRLLWTAPVRDVGQLWFAGSAVTSNGEGDTANDGVTDFGRVFASPSSASALEPASAQCSAAAVGGGARRAGWPALTPMLALLFALMRRRAQRPARLVSRN